MGLNQLANFTSSTLPVVERDLNFMTGVLDADFESKIVDVRPYRSASIALSWSGDDNPAGTWKVQFSIDNSNYFYVDDLEYSFSGAGTLFIDIPVLNAAYMIVEYDRLSGGGTAELTGTLILKS